MGLGMLNHVQDQLLNPYDHCKQIKQIKKLFLSNTARTQQSFVRVLNDSEGCGLPDVPMHDVAHLF